MTREELDRRNAAALTRHYRTWTDNAGQAPRGLLDDLARIADEHAHDVVLYYAEDQKSAPSGSAPGSTESHGAVTPAPARTAARRPAARAGTRRGAK